MGDFYDGERFPDEFKVGSSVGLEFNVDMIVAGRNSQSISRFKRSPYPVKKFNMSKVMLSGEDLTTLYNWIYAMGGPFTGFRLKDWTDYKSCDVYSQPSFDDTFQQQAPGIGLTEFQLVKSYGLPGRVIQKPILKPVVGTVKIGVLGVEKEEFTDYTVDYNTGIVTMVVGGGHTVNAGFEYDTPVIFQDADIDGVAFVTQTATQAGSLRFIELLQP